MEIDLKSHDTGDLYDQKFYTVKDARRGVVGWGSLTNLFKNILTIDGQGTTPLSPPPPQQIFPTFLGNRKSFFANYFVSCRPTLGTSVLEKFF